MHFPADLKFTSSVFIEVAPYSFFRAVMGFKDFASSRTTRIFPGPEGLTALCTETSQSGIVNLT